MKEAPSKTNRAEFVKEADRKRAEYASCASDNAFYRDRLTVSLASIAISSRTKRNDSDQRHSSRKDPSHAGTESASSAKPLELYETGEWRNY